MKKFAVYPIVNGSSQESVFVGNIPQCVDFVQSYGSLYDDLMVLDVSSDEDSDVSCSGDCYKCDLLLNFNECGYERTPLASGY